MSNLKPLQDIWAVALKEKGLENDYKDCFGCGPENLKGLQIKSFWDGKQAICRWKAEPHHNGVKGILNGGIIASLIDCVRYIHPIIIDSMFSICRWERVCAR